MARKGNKKVRTGCLTCKSRKVKCDETKPLCKRCTSTGRQCDGYAAQPLVLHDNSFSLLLRSQKPHHTFGAITDRDEGRALQYFCAAGGPLLSGGNESSFWTKLVMQFTHFEPAARHSVVAISLLHEQIHSNTEMGVSLPSPNRELLPLKHYNLAIRELKSMNAIDKQPVVLFVCVLFICLELLLDNRDVALQHCRHGLAILSQVVHRYPWTQEHLFPIFRRLSVLPLLFSREDPEYSAWDSFVSPQYERFDSFADAQYSLDEIFRRTLLLTRRGNIYRVGAFIGQPVSEELMMEQASVSAMLDGWDSRFTTYDDRLLITSNNPEIELYDLDTQYVIDMTRKFLYCRYQICRILTTMAFAEDEMCYDDYADLFQEILDQLLPLDQHVEKEPEAQSRPLKFIFEQAFQPVMYFMVAKCRHLQIRLQTLRLLRIIAVPQESMWNLDSTYHLCRRIVEVEHNVVLSASGKPLTPVSMELPPDAMRIRDIWTHGNLRHEMRNGKLVSGRTVGFVLPTADGGVTTLEEFLCEDASHLEEGVSDDVPLRRPWDISLQFQSFELFRNRQAEARVVPTIMYEEERRRTKYDVL